MASDTSLPGYETVFGSKKATVLYHVGPNPYSTTAYDVVNASQLGWGGFDVLAGTVPSDSNTYFVRAYYATTAPASATSSIALRWYVASSGSECTALDLSAERVRLLLLGV